MEKKQWRLLVVSLVLLFLLTESSGRSTVRSSGSINQQEAESLPPLSLQKLDQGHVVMDNGLVQVTLSTPEGMVTRIQYHGIDNILESNGEDNRGYWDIVWSNGQALLDNLKGTSFKVIASDENQIEISFTSTWNSQKNGRPLNVDKRFIMLRGSSGFYTYSIFERLKGWPAMSIDEARVAFKLRNKLFDYMAVSDTRQRIMPTPTDRSTGETLDYGEAVLLTNPSNEELKGEVDDKYQYSSDIKDVRVHGWITYDRTVGFWVITPSNEFRIGGPLKQELTSHVGPTSLSVFFSNHYAGTLSLEFAEGEAWKKVFGPIFIYLNSGPSDGDAKSLWNDAKQQMIKETEKWPYDFPLSEDFPRADQRGTVSGQLTVRDKYINKDPITASSAYVGLAWPGEVGSWQTENKGYQFWTQADAEGFFVIKGVRPGSYNLFAWVPGIIGDYKYDVSINVTPGNEIKLGNLVYDPLRIGPTIWEIGIADRTAAEFYVPEPYPDRVNYLYVNDPDNSFRQYGLWNRYSDLYSDGDLIYTVGNSTYKNDWFFAHVTRRTVNGAYVPTTWTILFDLDSVRSGTYTLQLALASISYADLQVRINDQSRTRPHFTTTLIGKDNAIARHGIHGLYSLYSVEVSSSQLFKGRNAIYLTQARGGSPFSGLMYDYLRFEGPF